MSNLIERHGYVSQHAFQPDLREEGVRVLKGSRVSSCSSPEPRTLNLSNHPEPEVNDVRAVTICSPVHTKPKTRMCLSPYSIQHGTVQVHFLSTRAGRISGTQGYLFEDRPTAK